MLLNLTDSGKEDITGWLYILEKEHNNVRIFKGVD